MNKHIDIGTIVKRHLIPEYRLIPLDIGGDAELSAKGFSFHTENYEVEGVGHLCIMTMKAMLGLMKMETAVLSVTKKDMPLINFDWVSVAGKETQIVELYDTQMDPFPQEWLEEYAAIKQRDADLADYVPKSGHDYDALKYEESYQKSAKGAAERLSRAADDYMAVFTRRLREAAACSSGKEERISAFADSLIADGGVAVDQMKKLFGEETAIRMIRNRMYGIKQQSAAEGSEK